MPQTVTLPVFGSANNQKSPSAEGSNNGGSSEWQMETNGDSMDFDLLAEYLLEDNVASSSGLNFDFNGEPANGSSVLVPYQSDNSVTIPENRPQKQNSNQASCVPKVTHFSTTIRPAPAPLAPAPSTHSKTISVAAKPQTVEGHGNVLGSREAHSSHNGKHIAPTPPYTLDHTSANLVQLGIAEAAKRRRLDSQTVTGAQVLSDPVAVAAAIQGRGRKKTQAQIDRRRERNRILARRTRLRKKFFFESLQKEVVDLQRENVALKDIVRTQLSDDGKQLLDECDAMERMPQAIIEACGEQANEYDEQDFNLVRSIQQSQHSFVITDPSLQDNPIVFASDDFLRLTGYTREEVLGRNCRFLQGSDTCQSKVGMIRKALANGDDVSVTMVNYTADGAPFWNQLFIAALRDAQNNIVNFIGVVVKVVSPDSSDPEYGKRLPFESEMDASDVESDQDFGHAVNDSVDTAE